MRTFARFRFATVAVVSATLIAGCSRQPTVNGDYRVMYVWDHGRVAAAKVEAVKPGEQISPSAKDEILSTARPFIGNIVSASNLTQAKGLVKLTIFSPKPFFVQVHELTITEPDFEDLVFPVELQDTEGIRRQVNTFHNVNQRAFGSRRTALSFAAAGGYISSMKTLLELGADPNLSDDIGVTPLMYALIVGNEEGVKLLLHAGTNASAVDASGESAASLAQKLHREKILPLLADDTSPSHK
jgi:hypothetical protein